VSGYSLGYWLFDEVAAHAFFACAHLTTPFIMGELLTPVSLPRQFTPLEVRFRLCSVITKQPRDRDSYGGKSLGRAR
jgi:hypothetical protein